MGIVIFSLTNARNRFWVILQMSAAPGQRFYNLRSLL